MLTVRLTGAAQIRRKQGGTTVVGIGVDAFMVTWMSDAKSSSRGRSCINPQFIQFPATVASAELVVSSDASSVVLGVGTRHWDL